MKKIGIIILFIIISLKLMSQYTSSGTDFWFSFIENQQSSSGLDTCMVYIASENGAIGIISIPGQGWYQNFSVGINSSISIQIPNSLTPNHNIHDAIPLLDTIVNKSIHIISNNPISVYIANYLKQSSDASIVFPTNALGNEYIIMTYTALPGYSNLVSEFSIVATNNNTQIEITPTANIIGGPTAGTTYTITLNAGQLYIAQTNGDFTGTYIKATNIEDCNTKFAVFAGNDCAYVPTSCAACDHLFEQMIPTSAWGKEYLTSPLKNRNGDQFRILAKDSGTIININGGAPINLDAGQFYETYLTQASYITSNNPICVAQYSRGSQCDNTTSDPFMIILSPIEQFINHVAFDAFNTSHIFQFYVNVITKTSFTNILTLDGSILSGWTSISSNPEYSYKQINITKGTHILNSDSGFTNIVYGFGVDDSYGYLGGAKIKPIKLNGFIINHDDTIKLNEFHDTLRCNNLTHEFFVDDTSNFINISWDFGDGSVATGSPVFHTFNNSNNSYIVKIYFERKGTCHLDSIIGEIIIDNTLNIDAHSNKDTICLGDSIELNVSGANYYLWSTGDTASNLILYPPSSNTYLVTGTDIDGCTDTAFISIHVNDLPNVTITTLDTNICLADSLTLTANGAQQYLWSTGNTEQSIIVKPITNTSYYLTGIDNNGCKNYDTINIIVHPQPDINITAMPDTNICINNNVTLQASGGVNYNWSNGNSGSQIILTINATTQYIVTGIDNYGCSNTDSIIINAINKPNVDFSADPLSGCEPLLVTFNNTSDNGTYKWHFGDGSISLLKSPTHIYHYGMYNVTLITTNIYGCSDTLIKNNYITVYPKPSASFYAIPQIIIVNNPVYINDQSAGASSWFYDFGDPDNDNDLFYENEPSYIYQSPGYYTIYQIVNNQYGCIDTAYYNVIVKDETLLYIPNAFTPFSTQDINDLFHIFGSGISDENFSFTIFNRWGEIIFYTTNLTFNWDGKFNGEICPQGVYTYKLRYQDADAAIHELYGYILIIY